MRECKEEGNKEEYGGKERRRDVEREIEKISE